MKSEAQIEGAGSPGHQIHRLDGAPEVGAA